MNSNLRDAESYQMRAVQFFPEAIGKSAIRKFGYFRTGYENLVLIYKIFTNK